MTETLACVDGPTTIGGKTLLRTPLVGTQPTSLSHHPHIDEFWLFHLLTLALLHPQFAYP